MTKRQLPLPTDAELDLLRVLWDRGPATVRQVFEKLNSTPGIEVRQHESRPFDIPQQDTRSFLTQTLLFFSQIGFFFIPKTTPLSPVSFHRKPVVPPKNPRATIDRNGPPL